MSLKWSLLSSFAEPIGNDRDHSRPSCWLENPIEHLESNVKRNRGEKWKEIQVKKELKSIWKSTHLHSYEVAIAMNTSSFRKAKEEGDDTAEDHPAYRQNNMNGRSEQ